MTHIALYRAWRPQTFQDMVGQQHIVRTLQNAIREQRIAHAYLFNGPRGTGKTTAAKVFAKAINCVLGPVEEPCNECDACKGITAGTILDVIEIDAASNRGIDEIREIRDKVRYAPSEVRYKVYIIDEIHMLTTEAFNALLKTLEEPPSHVVFILATTEPHKLPATIVSRCQRFNFRQVSLEEQTNRLLQICQQEGIEAEEDALAYIARLSGGGMRDAISLLEQAAAFSAHKLTLQEATEATGGILQEQFDELAQVIATGEVGNLFPIVEQLIQSGKDPEKCLENLIYYFRDLLVLKLAPGHSVSTERILNPQAYLSLVEQFTAQRLFSMIDTLNKYQSEMRHAALPQTIFEVALMKITLTTSEESVPKNTSPREAAPVHQSADITRLQKHITQLEQKFADLLSRSPKTIAQSSVDRPVVPSVQTTFSTSKFSPYLQAVDSAETQQVRARWSEILQKVKQTKIPVHAWLVDGTPIAVLNHTILIAFKNVIHRETTEKPANREIIELVLRQLLHEEYNFITILRKDWDSMQENVAPPIEDPIFEVATAPSAPLPAPEKPWIEEALQLFGNQLVTLTDDV